MVWIQFTLTEATKGYRFSDQSVSLGRMTWQARRNLGATWQELASRAPLRLELTLSKIGLIHRGFYYKNDGSTESDTHNWLPNGTTCLPMYGSSDIFRWRENCVLQKTVRMKNNQCTSWVRGHFPGLWYFPLEKSLFLYCCWQRTSSGIHFKPSTPPSLPKWDPHFSRKGQHVGTEPKEAACVGSVIDRSQGKERQQWKTLTSLLGWDRSSCPHTHTHLNQMYTIQAHKRTLPCRSWHRKRLVWSISNGHLWS